MKDFKDWDEVKEWLSDVDEMEGVFAGNMYFSHTYMSCGEGCCAESFDSLNDTVEYIKSVTNGDASKVDRV